MDIKDNKYVWFGISTLIIAALVYFADIERIFSSLRSANPIPLIPAFILGLSLFPFWSYVWYRIFQKSGINTSYRKAVKIFMAGNFMNSITPLGQAGGEPFMAYLLEKNSGASYEKSFSSIFSADVLNATPSITFVIGGAIFLGIFGKINQTVLQALYVALTATLLGGTLVYLLWFRSGKIETTVAKIAHLTADKTGRGKEIAGKIEEKLERLRETFNLIGEDPLYLFKTSVLSHTAFLFQVFTYYFIMMALGYTTEIAPIFFVVVFSGLANFSPTPGGSGTYEAAMAGLTTAFFSVSFATGLTAAIIFRLTTYWPGILLGYLALNSLNKKVEK